MTPGEAHQMRTRTRNRAISRLIENHRAEFDAMVAEERARAEAWQRRIDQRLSEPPADELLQLRETILSARRALTPKPRRRSA